MNQNSAFWNLYKAQLVKVAFLVNIIFTSFSLHAETGAKGELGQVDSADKEKIVEKQNSDFQIKIDIQNGHIGHVFIGCQRGATDNFDSRVDDMAPPPGMGGVGYTFLVSPDKKYNLYRDIRGFSDTVQWLFYAKTGTNPVGISWNAESIPKDWNMYCSPWDGKSENVTTTYDCRQTTFVETDKTGFFRFRIERRNVAKSTSEN